MTPFQCLRPTLLCDVSHLISVSLLLCDAAECSCVAFRLEMYTFAAMNPNTALPDSLIDPWADFVGRVCDAVVLGLLGVDALASPLEAAERAAVLVVCDPSAPGRE